MLMLNHLLRRYPEKFIRSNVPYFSKKGLTLIELMIVLSIIATLAGIAAPSYLRFLSKGNVSETLDEIKAIERNIEIYKDFYGQYPESLADIGHKIPRDKWGNEYQYMKIEGKKGFGGMRKDRNMVPINTDYDLYSKGADGKTSQSFQPKTSWDDIVRANNGEFIGLVSDY